MCVLQTFMRRCVEFCRSLILDREERKGGQEAEGEEEESEREEPPPFIEQLPRAADMCMKMYATLFFPR